MKVEGNQKQVGGGSWERHSSEEVDEALKGVCRTGGYRMLLQPFQVGSGKQVERKALNYTLIFSLRTQVHAVDKNG